jgi:hypothetical protein
VSALDELPWYVAKWIRDLVERGDHTDDEIVEEVEQLSVDLEHETERLDDKGYLPDRRFTARDRRLVRAGIAEVRGSDPDGQPAVPDATAANVRAERDRRRSAGEPHGYKALAKAFVVSPTTIRRRLGETK